MSCDPHVRQAPPGEQGPHPTEGVGTESLGNHLTLTIGEYLGSERRLRTREQIDRAPQYRSIRHRSRDSDKGVDQVRCDERGNVDVCFGKNTGSDSGVGGACSSFG
jgi:hypothetical protein